MKTKIFILFCVVFTIFISCTKQRKTSLLGNWINNQQDTLFFFSEQGLHYKPHILTISPHLYSYEVVGDSIALVFAESSNTNDIHKYFFKSNDSQIEIRNFQNIEFDIYKRLK
ncbi:MAG: hypothetical protein LBS50_04255 [Prevotellaceae bacterium]|jgi:hypothetical protein|nr:hypothetical protein [Prevotellaceae bacterium]